MKFTYKQYQEAKYIVSVFEKERDEIRRKRSFNNQIQSDWSLNTTIWKLRYIINREMYGCRNLPTEEKTDEIIRASNSYVEKLKRDLLKLRFEAHQILTQNSNKYEKN